MIREMNREMEELKADMREIREMIRELNRELKADMREMNREMRVMQELKADIREMNREMRVMQELKADIREMNREMREMQELKADIREMKKCMQRLSRSASADWNINASSLDHQIKKSEEVEFQLLFANKLPDKIFTRDKIRDESDGYVQIKLIDTISRETIELDPLSSMELEIVVLDGDFGYEGNENWTEQEFNAKIVHQRKSKGPLVKGKQNITLRKGVGIIGDLSFSDNSSWKDHGFRLGARVLQSRSMGQARIKEAISQAFVVQDHRTRIYHEKRSKKFNLPSLDNDVSPLKKIKKNAKCHTDNNIHTVKDFKQMHGTNLNKQIEILKDCSDSDREVIVQDASCVVDGEKLNAVQVEHQGMQNANNHASSSHDHKGGFSTDEEIVPNLASQPLDTSTGYPIDTRPNAFDNRTTGPLPHEHSVPHQGLEGMQNDCNPASSSQYMSELRPGIPDLTTQPLAMSIHYQNNDFGELDLLTPMSNTQPMTESSQINNGPHPHISCIQPSFALEADLYTGLLHPDQYAVPNQGFAGMQNASNHASSSHDHKGGFSTAEEIVPNLASQPMDTSTGYPVNAQGLKSNSNFDPSSSQYMSDELLQEIDQNDVYGDPKWNSSQVNEINNFTPSRNSYITTEDSQINKRQNTVMTGPFWLWNDHNLPNLLES